MKYIDNGVINKILFVGRFPSAPDVKYLSFKQIGSDLVKLVPATLLEYDCFTFTVNLDLVADYTPNGMYEIEILDTNKVVIATSTAIIDKMSDGDKRSWIVEDEFIGVAKLKTPTDINVKLDKK